MADQSIQTTFTSDAPIGRKGQIADNDFASKRSVTLIADHSIEFGNYGAEADTTGKTARRPFATAGVLTFAGNVTAGDIITGNVVVKSVADSVAAVTTPISQAFDTSQAVTAAALAVLIAAVTDVASAAVRAASSDLIIDVVMDANKHLTLSSWAAAGGSEPAIAVSYSTTDRLIGPFAEAEKEGKFDSSGDYYVRYEQYDTANAMTKGKIFETSEDAADTSKSVAVKLQGTIAEQGSVRTYASGGTVPTDSTAAPNAKIRSSADAAAVFTLEINSP